MADRDEAALIQAHFDRMLAALAAAPEPSGALHLSALVQSLLSLLPDSSSAAAFTSIMEQQLLSMTEGSGATPHPAVPARPSLSSGDGPEDSVSQAELEMLLSLVATLSGAGSSTFSTSINHALRGSDVDRALHSSNANLALQGSGSISALQGSGNCAASAGTIFLPLDANVSSPSGLVDLLPGTSGGRDRSAG
jgi:hypothetical protein